MGAKILRTDFNGDYNVGLYAFLFEKEGENICLLGSDLPEEVEEEVAKTLNARIVKMKVAGTPLVGVFITGNKKKILVPSIAFETELKTLDKEGIPYEVIETNLTCLGNNIVCNEKGALVNPEFSDEEVKKISDALGVPAKRMRVAELEGPGAALVLRSDGKKQFGIIHLDAEEFEIEMAADTLGLERVDPCSVNMGSPYLRSGIIVGKGGFVVGGRSGGPEIIHIEEGLGFDED